MFKLAPSFRMLKKFLLCFLISAPLFGFADGYIDSVKNVLQNPALSDSGKIAINNLLGREYLYSNADSSKYYSNNVLFLVGNEKSYLKEKAFALNNLGAIKYLKGDLDSAVYFWESSLKIRTEIGDKFSQMAILNNLGLVFWKRGRLLKALDYYHSSLEIAMAENHKPNISSITLNMGNIFENQRRYAEALEQYFFSLDIKKEIKDYKGMCTIYNNIGTIFNMRNEKIDAQRYFEKALHLSDSIQFNMAKAISQSNLGNIATDNKNYDQAEVYFKSALEIAKKLNIKNELAEVHLGLGRLYDATNKPKKAKNHTTKAYKIADEMGVPKMIYRCSEVMVSILEKEGNYKEALQYALILQKAKDEVFDSEKSWEIGKIVSDLANEKENAVKELERLKLKASVNEAVYVSNFLSKLFMGLLIAVFLIGLLSFITFQKISAKNDQLKKQQEKISIINRLLQDSLLDKNQTIDNQIKQIKELSENKLQRMKLHVSRIDGLVAVFKNSELNKKDKAELFERIQNYSRELNEIISGIESKFRNQ